jgi:hypothetical protein
VPFKANCTVSSAGLPSMSSSRITSTPLRHHALLGWLTSSYGKAIMKPAETRQSSRVPGRLWRMMAVGGPVRTGRTALSDTAWRDVSDTISQLREDRSYRRRAHRRQ